MLPMPGAGVLTAAAGAGAVGALAPQALEQFGRAMTELAATVGEALLPALEALTGVVRQIADAVAPLMRALAPVLKEITEVLGTLLLGAVYALVGVFTALGSAFGDAAGGIRDFKQGLMDFVRFMTRGLAYLIKAFAGADAVKKWAEAVGGKGTRATLGPRDAAVRSLADIAGSITASAFAAGAGAGDSEAMRAFQEQMAEDLRQVAKDGKDFGDWVKEKLLPALEALFWKIWRELKGSKAGMATKGAIFGPVGLLPEITEIAAALFSGDIGVNDLTG